MKRRHGRSGGYTVVELFTTVAALVIVLGLMVNLARQVRQTSARRVTIELLQRLERLMAQYQKEQGSLPAVTPLIPLGAVVPEDAALHRAAERNNRQLVSALRWTARAAGEPLEQLPPSRYDGQRLLDAWGSPIVYMPRMHPEIGMAAPVPGAERDRHFFFSAGPDRLYLTRQDNLYSYEAEEGTKPEESSK